MIMRLLRHLGEYPMQGTMRQPFEKIGDVIRPLRRPCREIDAGRIVSGTCASPR